VIATALKRRVGDRWERAARRELHRQGLAEVACNYSCRFGEIDLIMQDKDQLCFIEVRYRADSGFGGPAESVDRAKCRKLVLTADHFLSRHPDYQDWHCRFDVVTISGKLLPRVRWLIDAFSADDF
jgi:putative endonuclease